MSDEARRELEAIKSDLYRLSYRVRALEERLTRESRGSNVGTTPSVRPEPEVARDVGATAPIRLESPAHPEPRVAPPPMDEEVQAFERVLGGKVALYTGLTLLFLATAFFLGWAWTQLSPAGRLTLGYVGGVLLMGLGIVVRERTERWFSDGLMGAGLATLYLSTWAGWERYALLGYMQAFGLTGAITALGIALALWRGSETLAIVATLGGFSAPVWLRGDSAGAPANFFGYLAVLNAGMLTVSAWRAWRYHQLTCLVATIVLVSGWAMTSYTPEYRGLTLGFVSLYYALFSVAYLLPDALRRRATDAVSLAQFLVASLHYLPAGYALTQEVWREYPGAFLAAMGALYFALGWLKMLTKDSPTDAALFILGIVCVAAAIAVQFQPSAQVVLYGLTAAGLILAGLRLQTRLLYGFGILLTLAAVAAMWTVLIEPIRTRTVLLNEHGVGWLALLIGGSAALYGLYRDMQARPQSALDSIFPRYALAHLIAPALVIALAWGSAEQTLYAFELAGRRDAPLAHLLVSLEWTLIGAGLLIGGVQASLRGVRLMGLGMLALTTTKLFLYDLGFLEMPYRALSFAGLGLALIGVAWLYSRFGTANARAN
ncbi:DUF2339 domain-containing protein [Synechococcus sp. RC10A2]|uniref:DUF2339 domain-containing protein n=1 Tax=Synechococcus sp. RC10A2 TaxID=2964529 RepID=UPI0039C6A02D